MPLRALVRPLLASLALLVAISCGGSDSTGPDPAAVASVAVIPSSATVDVGATVQLSATATNSQGETVAAPVSWSSSATGVATVSSSGLVTGVGEGTASITASAGGRSATATVTVVDPTPPDPPTGLTAAPASHTEVELSWTDASDNEDGFEVERERAGQAAAPDGVQVGASGADGSPAAVAFESVATVGAGVTTFRDTGLDPATTYRYRVRAVNENGASAYAAPAEATTWATLTLETAGLPDAVVDEAYQVTLSAEGGAGAGTFAWSLAAGALPAGLALSDGGVLSGTPTETGTFTMELSVTSGGQTVSRSFDLTVREEAVPPQVVTTQLPQARLGVSYSETLQASGGDGSYAWALAQGPLPAGLSLAADGTVSGTPTEAGQLTVTVEVTSAGFTASGQVGITVVQESLEVTTTSLPDGEVGTGYQATLASTGGLEPVTWTLEAGNLPQGITLQGDGTLSGTPTLAETATFTMKATSDDGQEATAELSITVAPGPVNIVTDDLDGGQAGTAYSLSLAAGGGDGTGFTWSLAAGSPPPGLTLGSLGVLSGTPTSTGTFEFTVRAESGGRVDTKVMILTTVPQPRSGYQIDLVYLTRVTSSIRSVFEDAAARWSELITGDEVDEVGGIPGCGSFHPATQATVDDVFIYVAVEEIDGEGGTLGQAAPCWVRDGNLKPLTGAMVFDEADVSNLVANNLLSRVILHEMGHVLGIGVIWDDLDLLTGECIVDPIFTGAGAIEAFNDADGVLYSGEPVPVEDTGSLGDGSNCSHWRESVMGKELMTPFLNSGDNPLSAITVRSLGDLGYTVDASQADPYLLPKPVPVEGAALRSGLLMRDDLLPIPLRALGPDGKARPVGSRR